MGDEVNVQRIAPFKWTSAREKAAALAADDTKSDEQIAAEIGIAERTFYNWKRQSEFAARVSSLVADAAAVAKAQTIANKERRVQRLQERSEKLDRVIEARATEHAAVPGGNTGLLVREPKIVKVYSVTPPGRRGSTSAADEDDEEMLTPTGGVQVVYEYRVDTATLAEMRNTEKQAAQELGEWSEKKELTGANGEPLIKAYLGLDLDEV